MNKPLGRVVLPKIWRLWAPGHGYVLGTGGSSQEMSRLLSDRKANGQAFPNERVERTVLEVSLVNGRLIVSVLDND